MAWDFDPIDTAAGPAHRESAFGVERYPLEARPVALYYGSCVPELESRTSTVPLTRPTATDREIIAFSHQRSKCRCRCCRDSLRGVRFGQRAALKTRAKIGNHIRDPLDVIRDAAELDAHVTSGVQDGVTRAGSPSFDSPIEPALRNKALSTPFV